VRVKFIRRAKTPGYKLDEIRELLAASEQGKSPCLLAREIIERRIHENRKALDETLALQKRMESAVHKWRDLPDGVLIGDSICHLIEQATAGL
jgi:DNA-binding transcriptional MerR regulator